MNQNRTEKKKEKYEAPKIFRVVLNHDQAILAGCSTGSGISVSTGSGAWCRSACRRATSSSATSASRS